MRVHLRYGRRGLDVELPDKNVVKVLRLKPLPVLADPQAAVLDGLRAPIGTPPLAELARGKQNAAVVISDITRPVPNRAILPPLLAELERGGLKREQVTVLVGTGLHRANTEDELREMVGEEVLAGGWRIANHVARDMDAQVYCGTTQRGTPVYVDRVYAEADLRILTGLIEPHLMAGYSGGRKAICPSICGMETIRIWHGPTYLEPEESCAGNLAGNPVHEEALAVAKLAGGADLIVNVTMDDRREVTGVFVGEMQEAHLAGVRHLEPAVRDTVPEPVDIALTTNAGHPLDLTFYQGVKGMVAALPIVKEGGTIIIAHECAEGIGGPEFTRLILETDDLEAYIQRTYEPGFFCLDQWQLHEMLKVVRRAEVLNFSGGISREDQARMFVTPVESVEAAVAQALKQHGPDATIAVIPEGPYVLAAVE